MNGRNGTEILSNVPVELPLEVGTEPCCGCSRCAKARVLFKWLLAEDVGFDVKHFPVAVLTAQS
jgi:hypothetical protein